MSPTNRRLPLVCVLAMSIGTSGYALFCYLHGFLPGEPLFDLYFLVCFMLVVSWVVSDPAIPRTHKPSFDHAMLTWMTFPVFAVCQMYAAHKWRGIAMLLGMYLLIWLPSIVLGIAWVISR
jgi:hypothetical protein